MGDLLPYFASAGGTGLGLLIGYWLHRDAVRAHDLRAQEWKAAYDREVERGDERERQLAHIIAAVRQVSPL